MKRLMFFHQQRLIYLIFRHEFWGRKGNKTPLIGSKNDVHIISSPYRHLSKPLTGSLCTWTTCGPTPKFFIFEGCVNTKNCSPSSAWYKTIYIHHIPTIFSLRLTFTMVFQVQNIIISYGLPLFSPKKGTKTKKMVKNQEKGVKTQKG